MTSIRLSALLGTLLTLACVSPAPVPTPATPTAVVLAMSDPPPPTPAPSPLPAPEPTATAQLQSHADGPAEEPVLAEVAAAQLEPSAIPQETITPAEACDPNQPAQPLGRNMPGGFGAFRAPLPATPLYNPPGTKRVGLQAGHWLVEESPPELGRLQGGATGGGKQEWQVNLEIAERAATLLQAAGYEVDVLASTVPIRYQAHVFVSIHADGDTSGALTGYKIARPGFSSVPEHDNRLVESLYDAYGPATGLRRDDEHISLRMTYYYAFNSRRYCHAVSLGVPQAIVETGFLTSPSDRQVIVGNPDAPAQGIADGIQAFLRSLP